MQFESIIYCLFSDDENEKQANIKKKGVQSSDSDDEANRLPLTRLRPNRNRPMLCDTSFHTTNRTSNYRTRSNRSYGTIPSGHQAGFQPRSSTVFRPRTNRTEKVTGEKKKP